MSYLYQNYTKDQIAKKLLDIAESKLLVKRVVNKYRKNGFYSMIFNEADVRGELDITIALVINNLEKYNENQKCLRIKSLLNEKEISKIKTNSFPKSLDKKLKSLEVDMVWFKENYMKVLESKEVELKLNTESEITGYLINAFSNNIRKIYFRNENTSKRSFNQMYYLDSAKDEGADKTNKNFLESIGSHSKENELNYKSTVLEMAVFLKKYDKRQNLMNGNQKSQLAKLFCSIVNPRKCKENDEIKNEFNWSPYLLSKNKEILIKKLQEEFKGRQEDILSFLDEREQYRKAVNY